MKKLPLLGCALLCILFSACLGGDNDIRIAYTNNDDYYVMNAKFQESKTRNVENYLDRKLGRGSNLSFTNTQLSGTIALDDGTIFYIKKSPGFLRIKLDKTKNSEEAYERMRMVCEGVKKVVVGHS